MPYNPFHIANLLSTYFKGYLNAAQEKDLEEWLEEDPDNRKLLEELSDQESLRGKLSVMAEVDEEATWEKTLHGIRGQSPASRPAYLSKTIAIAASIIVVIGLGLWFGSDLIEKFAHLRKDVNYSKAKSFKDISPGSVGATLTLANGKKIVLSAASDGQLAHEAGVTISKTADGQLVYEMKPSKESAENPEAVNTLTTANGQTYIVTLPDKTKIWLNAASSLSFASGLLKDGLRKVRLSGEAYFEVHKDVTSPFIVESRGQRIEVLGTHFNIKSYEDENNTSTTLLEGSVRVLSDIRGSRPGVNSGVAVLVPGQQAILREGGQLSVKEVDIEPIIAWRNGVTSFRNAEIKTIMRQIARWYNVDVKYEQGLPGKLFSGDILRNANLSEVIRVIEFSGVKLKVEGRTVTVMP